MPLFKEIRQFLTQYLHFFAIIVYLLKKNTAYHIMERDGQFQKIRQYLISQIYSNCENLMVTKYTFYSTDVCHGQELVHRRQQLSDDQTRIQTAVDNLKRCFRLMQWFIDAAISSYWSEVTGAVLLYLTLQQVALSQRPSRQSQEQVFIGAVDMAY